MPLGGFLTPGVGLSVLANNPNDGMIVLGEKLHKQGGGVAFGVPQRPCDVDKRGCIKDYMDANTHELESPEFNDRLDFIREAFVVAKLPMADGRSWNFQLGKQQVVWGRTDLFRVLDVINPVDYSRNNIYDELQDIRIPMWIFTAEYRMGATETFDDTNVQFVWNFDKFRPNNLGQGGTPNQILNAGDFFRGMKNLWDNGGTVANFAGAAPGAPGAATTFGPNQIGECLDLSLATAEPARRHSRRQRLRRYRCPSGRGNRAMALPDCLRYPLPAGQPDRWLDGHATRGDQVEPAAGNGRHQG
jgi:hypothetical protein